MSIAPHNPEQAGLDEPTAALSLAAMHVSNTILQGKELRTRDMALRSASGVISSFLRTMEYPRDQGLLPQLAWLAQELTEFLDHIVLNAGPDDERLQALRTLAESAVAWPILVRPGDERLTALKIETLKVGARAPLGSLGGAKRRPSLGTPRNRLALRLVGRIQNRTECILLVTRNGGPAQRCNTREAREHLRVIEPGIPEKEHTRFLKLLQEARDHPFSAGEAGRQKTKKERPFPTPTLNRASAFVKHLRTLLNEVFKCTKTLSQLLIAALLMLEFCKEQQHSDVSDHLRPWDQCGASTSYRVDRSRLT